MNINYSFRVLSQVFQLSRPLRLSSTSSVVCSQVQTCGVKTNVKMRSSPCCQNLTVICRRFRRNGCLINIRTMAGHSKWQNIKHIKAAKDSEKSKIIVQITNRIRSVIRETGNADPKLNASLARLVAEAKSKNVPSSNIEGAIEQAIKARNASSIIFYEGRGPGGSYFIVEASTDKAVKTKNDLQGLIKKQGAVLGDQGTAKHAFDKKGVLEATVPEGNVDMDAFVDMAIEAGAEDVTMETDETDEKYLRFVCEADDLYTVKKELEKKSLELRAVNVEYLPLSVVTPQPKDMELIGKLMEKLEDSPEVLRVFINVDAPNS